MSDRNTATLSGNLTRDPQERRGPTYVLATTSIAVNQTWKTRDGEQKENVMFIDLEAWGEIAELMLERGCRGAKVLITGPLKYNRWQGKDGRQNSKHNIIVKSIEFLTGDTASSIERGRSTPEYDSPEETGIPF